MSIDRVVILKRDGYKCEVAIGSGSKRTKRNLFFSDERVCKSFVKCVQEISDVLGQRSMTHMRNSIGNLSSEHPANLLIEIVSASDLRNADVTGSSDPYCVIQLGDRRLHKTDRIDNNVNPIWTLEHNCFCLVTETMKCFFGAMSGVTFEVYDYDSVGNDESLGQVNVLQADLLKGEGKRMELPLTNDSAKHKNQGVLVIRSRKATKTDLMFMARLKSDKAHMKKRGVVSAHQSLFISPVPPPTKFSALQRQRKEGKADSETLIRTRPCPEPGHEEETKWMSKYEIEKAAYAPSKSWVEAGTGEIGNLYIEIIG